jgi:succinate dehydrogenase/fumarate reductase cytochrome b subunit
MTATRPLGDLRTDNKGAVMLTGLFMSCFLIGALWFVVGIGDTLVYRDRMQEATDHGAFAASALNAKGMNFISLCNLILLVAVTIHIILGIIHDIALALCIVSFGTTCGFWAGIRQLYTGYFDVLKPAARAIHTATKVSSYGFPVMGLAESLNIAKSYSGGKSGNVTVIPISPALLSGAAFGSILGASKKQGLTLEAKPMSLVCRRVSSMALDKLFSAALGVSGRGFPGKVLSLAKNIIGDVIEFRYCNDMSGKERLSVSQRVDQFIQEGKDYLGGKVKDATGGIVHGGMIGLGGGKGGGNTGNTNTTGNTNSGSGGIDPGFDTFWGEDGPMTVIGPAKNGNEWFQSYAINFRPELPDVSQSFVNISLGPNARKGGKFEVKVKPKGGFYLAQAEFFFDCATKWSTEGCNFEGNSTFALKWRSRLRRFSIPSFSSLLGNVGSMVLTAIPQYEQFKKLQGQLGGLGDMAKNLFGQSGILGMKDLQGFLGKAAKKAQDALVDAAMDALRDKAKAGVKAATQDIDVPFH